MVIKFCRRSSLGCSAYLIREQLPRQMFVVMKTLTIGLSHLGGDYFNERRFLAGSGLRFFQAMWSVWKARNDLILNGLSQVSYN